MRDKKEASAEKRLPFTTSSSPLQTKWSHNKGEATTSATCSSMLGLTNSSNTQESLRRGPRLNQGPPHDQASVGAHSHI